MKILRNIDCCIFISLLIIVGVSAVGIGVSVAVADEIVLINEKSEAALYETRNKQVHVQIGTANVEPGNLRVVPGATIVWRNTAEKIVRVRFTKNAISTSCQTPRKFNLGVKGIFESEPIPSGDIASICLLEPNIYTYDIDYLKPGSKPGKFEKTGETASGKIEVR